MSAATRARSERHVLCDLLDEVGPEAPTLCAGWTTSHLAAHLLIRERRPSTAPGLMFGGPFARHTSRVLERVRVRTPYPDLVERVRTGPPAVTRPLDGSMNLVEYFVHHEDVRRAVDGWSPRTGLGDLDDLLWERQGRATRFLVRRLSDVDLTLARPDGDEKHIGGGAVSATLTGEPCELVLFLVGRRDHAVVEVTGDHRAVAELRTGPLAL
ncbi:MAG TPA: TIGR03085 family protein [Acidimicrobiia bacterium]|nr:TIGR03085 family protein [Acidimicrobiia bacterium]